VWPLHGNRRVRRGLAERFDITIASAKRATLARRTKRRPDEAPIGSKPCGMSARPNRRCYLSACSGPRSGISWPPAFCPVCGRAVPSSTTRAASDRAGARSAPLSPRRPASCVTTRVRRSRTRLRSVLSCTARHVRHALARGAAAATAMTLSLWLAGIRTRVLGPPRQTRGR